MNRLAILLSALLIFSSCQSNQDASEASMAQEASAEVAAPQQESAQLSVSQETLAKVAASNDDLPEIAVYKTPTCGCCSLWVDHMKEAGFKVTTTDLNDLHPIKNHFGVSHDIESCHTAIVGGYVVEGHVPADVVQKMLEEKPDIAGIAVPGMPIGSPGMEVEGRPADRYNVIAFDKQGNRTVYAER